MREVKGFVYVDSNGNGLMESDEKPLRNVRVSLYSLSEENATGSKENGDGITLYSGSLLATTRTGENGGYRFLVRDGMYSLSIDPDTLPESLGVTQSSRLFDTVGVEDYNFAAAEAADIDVENINVSCDRRFAINPVIKDKYGRLLEARVSCSIGGERIRIPHMTFGVRHGDFENNVFNATVSSGTISRQFSIMSRVPEVSSELKVRIAYENDFIDERSKIRHYMNLLFDETRLDGRFGSDIPVKSGSTAVKEILDYIYRRDADRSLVRKAREYFDSAVPGLDRSIISPGGFFRINYTTTGSNAVPLDDSNGSGVPDYIEAVARAFDHVKNVTCGERGFRTPLTGNGKKVFEVYVYDLKGKYGITFPSTFYRGMNRVGTASSFISIDNSYSRDKGFKEDRDSCMKVTAAHEFFHAVQNAYNVNADSWWKEASATWNEDEVYTGVNDYLQYLGSVFSAPGRPLEKSSYGGVVFAKYLSENLGGYNTVKRIWETQAAGYSNSINAIDATLHRFFKNEDIGTVFNRFTACNYNPAQYYREGHLWTSQVHMENIYNTYPVTSKNGSLQHLSASYELFRPENLSKGKALRISVENPGNERMGFKLQKRRRSDNLCELTAISISGSIKRAEIICNSLGDTYSEICLIPANMEKSRDNASYSYSVTVG